MKKDQFLELLSKKLTNEISDHEINQLNIALKESEEYQKIAQTLSRYFDQKSNKNSKTDKLRLTWAKIAKAEKQNYREKYDYSQPKMYGFISSDLLKIAAVLFVLVTSSIIISRLTKKGTTDKLEMVQAAGQKSFKLLADGTRIWLNKNSSIAYNKDFGKHQREITLQGEAYFDVTKNPVIPLFIHVGHIDIEVKGTAFNVSAYKNDPSIQISLVRGLIQVTNKLESKNKVLLRPNEQLVIDNGSGGFAVMPINMPDLLSETKWTSDTLSFQKEKLKDLAPQMEKKYHLKIEIQSAQLKEKRFSGTFINETIQQALEALKLSYPLTYTINNKLVVIKD